MAGVTIGYFYFIESEVAQQNWIAGGADTIVIGNFTEGTHYVKLAIPKDMQKRFKTGITVAHLGGVDFEVFWGNRAYNVLSEGIETSRANADLIEKFLMADRHTIEASFVQYYLVAKYDATHFWEFTNHDNERKDYCRGYILDGAIIWSDTENPNAVIRLNWHSVW